MSISVFEESDADKAFLAAQFPGEFISCDPAPFTTVEQAEQIPADTDVAAVFVHSQVSAAMLAAMPGVKLIATRSTGYDHVDIAAAKGMGVTVSNVPTYGENTVAEHTFALILALSRNLHKAYVRTSSGSFDLTGLQGFDLQHRTLGIIGTGHIGLHVARIGRGFGMDVVAYDVYPNQTMAELLNFRYLSLDDLLQKSDIVSLHAPLTPATHHLIGSHNIVRMKPGALLINTARGALVDTEALLNALDSGALRGAGLDVIEGEEVFSEERQLLGMRGASEEQLRMALRNLTLLRRPDLVVTPHIAFDSKEAVERILSTTADNIRAFRAGTPLHCV